MIPPSPPPPKAKRFPLGDIILVLSVLTVLAAVSINVVHNMQSAGMTPGFAFLSQSAGFDVSEALLPYTSRDSYLRVVAVGLLNTLLLSALSLLLATFCGVLIGLASVSPSSPMRRLALGYVELFRNLPKLLILLVFFVVSINVLPPVRQAIALGPIHISNRSLYFPTPHFTSSHWPIAFAILLAIGSSAALWRMRSRMRNTSGYVPPFWPFAAIVLIGLPVSASLILALPIAWSVPELEGFDFVGGGRLSLQLMVVALTLALYHGAQIGEVVRGGIKAIPAGQSEAARALGLNRFQVTRFVILPQMMRIVIPPINNQYVNLIKNSSIAIAVGYSDLMSVTGTIINQTFRPLEMMLLTMGIYLAICLSVTNALNHFSDRLRRREGR